MKIGIITMYHNSLNYGANLQAYALQKVCSDLGYDAELVSYDNYPKIKYLLATVKRKLLFTCNRIVPSGKKNAYKCIGIRKKHILRFNKNIPHSKLFFSDTVSKINDRYDCFIVGSDQVWNPGWLNPFYTLQFAEKPKYGFSYAASLGVTELDDQQKTVFSKMLSRFDAVSVREDKSVELLENLTDKKVELVLDPTLLLDEEQWNEICAERLVDENYVFCFLFGNQEKPHILAKQYAEKHDCKLVTIPFLTGVYRKIDVGFGDYQLSNVGPEKFLSLIKYADCVFTDSFHATAISHIFKKNFISYAADDSKMRVRMTSLTKLFGTEDRFIGDETETDIDYIDSLPNADYSSSKTDFTESKRLSLEFLKTNLERGKKA